MGNAMNLKFKQVQEQQALMEAGRVTGAGNATQPFRARGIPDAQVVLGRAQCCMGAHGHEV